jgi:hypothetical protein
MRINFDTDDVAQIEPTPRERGSRVSLHMTHYPEANDGRGLWEGNGRPMDAASSVAVTVAGVLEAMERAARQVTA